MLGVRHILIKDPELNQYIADRVYLDQRPKKLKENCIVLSTDSGKDLVSKDVFNELGTYEINVMVYCTEALIRQYVIDAVKKALDRIEEGTYGTQYIQGSQFDDISTSKLPIANTDWWIAELIFFIDINNANDMSDVLGTLKEFSVKADLDRSWSLADGGELNREEHAGLFEVATVVSGLAISTTMDSNVVLVASKDGLDFGQKIEGKGIPLNAVISGINPDEEEITITGFATEEALSNATVIDADYGFGDGDTTFNKPYRSGGETYVKVR